MIYALIGIVLLGIGFILGYRTKKKIIDDIPGIRKFKVKDFFVLEPLLKTVAKRLEEATKDLEENPDFDNWLEQQLTLPEIRIIISCGVKDKALNIDELDYNQAFELFRKVRKANPDFFIQALRAKTEANLI